MLNKSLIIRLTTNTQHFRIYKQHLEKRELKCYLCELPCVATEEAMDSTDSALDEIASSFLHEFLSAYTRLWTSAEFFSLRNTVKVLHAFL